MKEKWQHIKQYLKTHKKTIIVLAVVKLLIKIGVLGYLLLSTTECRAQSTNKLIRSGNKLYNSQKYNNATEEYSKALQKEPKNNTAFFNQSDALYQLKEYKKAEEQFTTIANSSTVKPDVKAKAYHNLGNCYYKQEKYEESVKAYKNALKLAPEDKDTKYNLMMAQAKVQNKDKQQQQQQQQNQDQNKQDQQQQKDQKQQMSEEQAKRLLEMQNNEENKVQLKLEKKKSETKTGKQEKDW
jgi:tetratricopeptide (TPR) repeat protein